MGYGAKIIPDIVVNSGKEIVLNLSMQEAVIRMDEVVVRANKNQGEALNDMSLISARSISSEETKRYAGGFDDPSRILTSFAGVTNTQNGENDIIVRGNSPKYIQWRLDGVEISNPTHFADQNSTKGGISALNNNLISTSDFLTGAFSPEYGDVLSGVYDVTLRTGNNEVFESAFGFGLLGTDLTLEGPFKKGYGGSYLVNYRYSTISLINELGLVDVEGSLNYQDATFKVVLPTNNFGLFSFFGLGGLSNFSQEDVSYDNQTTPTNSTSSMIEDFDKSTHLLNLGMNHTLSINKNSFINTTLSYSSTGIKEDVFQSKDSLASRILSYKNRLYRSTYRVEILYSSKLNKKNKIQMGSKYSLFDYDYTQSLLQDDAATMFSVVDLKNNISTIRNFISWKYRFKKDITIVSGLHNMNVLLNNESTFEPRFAINWKLGNTNVIRAGYGNHSKMESIHNYYTRIKLEDGSVIEPNLDLDLLKAHHYILGYEKRFTENLRTTVEVYYQSLYDLPVENNDTSYYATINESNDFKYVDLVNKGTGKNYGVELTLEKFLDNNYYFLINGSLYNSKYKSLEGIERNTLYNGNYLANILFGKQFTNLGENGNHSLSLNVKILLAGGQRYIPLLRDSQGNLDIDPTNNRYWDYENAYENKIDDIFQLDISASYKFNTQSATHEIFLNLINITNYKGRVSEFYDETEPNSVGYTTQFGFFPNLMYRVYF